MHHHHDQLEHVLCGDRHHHHHQNHYHHHYHRRIIIIMINLSTCSAEITDILLSSLSFKGISRPPCGTNYVIVRMWICGIITFLIKFIMYIVYCNCIVGLEATINGKRSASQSVAY